MKSFCSTISPVNGDHLCYIGMASFILMLHSFGVTFHIWTVIIHAQKVGILTSQDRIPTINCYAIYIHAPTPGHCSSRPPDVKVTVHTNQPSRIPIKFKTNDIMRSRHSHNEYKSVSNSPMMEMEI